MRQGQKNSSYFWVKSRDMQQHDSILFKNNLCISTKKSNIICHFYAYPKQRQIPQVIFVKIIDLLRQFILKFKRCHKLQTLLHHLRMNGLQMNY